MGAALPARAPEAQGKYASVRVDGPDWRAPSGNLIPAPAAPELVSLEVARHRIGPFLDGRSLPGVGPS